MLDNHLKRKRLEKGLSQTELTMLTGIASRIISDIENKKQYPYPAWKRSLSEALGCEEEELFPNKSKGKGVDNIEQE